MRSSDALLLVIAIFIVIMLVLLVRMLTGSADRGRSAMCSDG